MKTKFESLKILIVALSAIITGVLLFQKVEQKLVLVATASLFFAGAFLLRRFFRNRQHKNFITLFFLMGVATEVTLLSFRIIMSQNHQESSTEKKEPIEERYSMFTNSLGWLVYNPLWPNQYYINQWGFRTPEFDDSCTGGGQSILFLGDSFTYGNSSSDYAQCAFPDLIRKQGYCVYNTGIVSADLPQYFSIARRLVPELKPDMVALMFYEHNDFIDFEREVAPEKPLFYVTNQGFLISGYDPDCPSNSFTFEQAKSYYMARQTWSPNTLSDFLRPNCEIVRNTFITRYYILAIKRVAELSGSKFFLFIIPDRDIIEIREERFRGHHPGIFDSLEIHIIPTGDSLLHYTQMPDMHWNDAGHQVAADFISKTIEGMSCHDLPTKAIIF